MKKSVKSPFNLLFSSSWTCLRRQGWQVLVEPSGLSVGQPPPPTPHQKINGHTICVHLLPRSRNRICHTIKGEDFASWRSDSLHIPWAEVLSRKHERSDVCSVTYFHLNTQLAYTLKREITICLFTIKILVTQRVTSQTCAYHKISAENMNRNPLKSTFE